MQEASEPPPAQHHPLGTEQAESPATAAGRHHRQRFEPSPAAAAHEELDKLADVKHFSSYA